MTTPKSPTVSVLLTAYNEEEYIADAIESILTQTYSDWELIIVDDGSTDATSTIVENYMQDDDRIRMFRSNHIGRARALNIGLSLVQGELIAIQDADDLSEPDRLERQVTKFNSNPDLQIVGGHVRFTDVKNKDSWVYKVPLTDRTIRLEAPKRMPFNHTTVMFRLPPGEIRYPIGDVHKDYFFCSQLMLAGRASNLDMVLATARRHEGSVTQSDQGQNYRRTIRTQLLVGLLLQSVHRGGFAAAVTIVKWIRHEIITLIQLKDE
jgi:glycosyltransferase involved in cell wall biosynthesis